MTDCALRKNVFTMMVFFKYNQLKSDEDQRIILTMLMSPTRVSCFNLQEEDKVVHILCDALGR